MRGEDGGGRECLFSIRDWLRPQMHGMFDMKIKSTLFCPVCQEHSCAVHVHIYDALPSPMSSVTCAHGVMSVQGCMATDVCTNDSWNGRMCVFGIPYFLFSWKTCSSLPPLPPSLSPLHSSFA